MDFIIATDKKVELGYLNMSKTLDIDLGNTNDFELTLDLDDWGLNSYTYGYLLYANGTEYGGIIEDIKVNTQDNTIKLKGYTWRGLLVQKIIEPPAGIAYKTVSGDANTVMASLIGSVFDGLIIADTELSGFTVNYQFDRYTTMLAGLEKMLASVGARLNIYFDVTDMLVHLGAVAIMDYSDTLEYSQDHQIDFLTRDYRCGINHLICLGSGELTAREVVHLYLQADGTIGSLKYYSGLAERVAVFDYPNAEDMASLTEAGLDRFAELLNYQSLQMTIGEISANIGDLVGGRERITGLSMVKPIKQKILKISGNTEKIEFKVGD
ncbi:Gp37-like protein [Parasporobacterium paucivorans]|uniref:Virus ReqiPepy6 Gp37-like protein n=1 Tax=Parasporobacterium paucivorans DSM 15970 TaxID=1122934 RepID=A0A1M6B1Q8_9FIRM|nr:hypothetical protein [Parasporobacterium paucivorans]SHI42423.1 virus ReqiPepy6 Gp37-like protein [Parasporobacterium paucivorans DSM 15970]